MDEASLRADMIEGLEHQIGETLDEPVLTALQRVSGTRSSTTGRLRPGRDRPRWRERWERRPVAHAGDGGPTDIRTRRRRGRRGARRGRGRRLLGRAARRDSGCKTHSRDRYRPRGGGDRPIEPLDSRIRRRRRRPTDDGVNGLPEYAPYDRILLEASVVKPPRALREQLAEGVGSSTPAGRQSRRSPRSNPTQGRLGGRR